MENDSAIDVRNLTVRFGDKDILANLSFTIKRGTITAIIGPNGSGKTTLLKTLMGFIRPFSGSVAIFGIPPREARRHIGYVPQRFSYDRTFPITVREFLSNSKAAAPHIDKTLEEAGLASKRDALFGTLSGGEIQRVLMARALLTAPRLLLLDEAASEVDIAGERTFYELVQHFNKTHRITVVMVSHELDIVFGYADVVLCLNHKLLCHGEPKRVLTENTVRNLYSSEVAIFKHNKNGS